MGWRQLVFSVGDLVLLTTTSALSAGIVVTVHAAISVFITAAVVGMVAGMAEQMLIAAVAAVLLGSIETMVPTMIAGMGATGLVCVFGLAIPIGHGLAIVFGAVAGLATFAALRCYSWCCHRRFARNTW